MAIELSNLLSVLLIRKILVLHFGALLCSAYVRQGVAQIGESSVFEFEAHIIFALLDTPGAKGSRLDT